MTLPQRGPKPAPKRQPREPLTTTPPRGLKGEARKEYVRLAEELVQEGYACQVDSRAVAMAAKSFVLLERVEDAVAALPSLTVATRNGERPHPLLGELRALRGQLQSLLGALFMTPRARSSSRISEELARQAASRARQGGKAEGLARFFDDGSGQADGDEQPRDKGRFFA